MMRGTLESGQVVYRHTKDHSFLEKLKLEEERRVWVKHHEARPLTPKEQAQGKRWLSIIHEHKPL